MPAVGFDGDVHKQEDAKRVKLGIGVGVYDIRVNRIAPGLIDDTPGMNKFINGDVMEVDGGFWMSQPHPPDSERGSEAAFKICEMIRLLN
ncbi:hypothetical protein FNV43_RR20145 [Rhamnella rubrinervis]|uniref:Uncharacterized protein n=1 Tax=Rhamnella rubrinervis TaxID=2594499 RepID=A0A8K0E5V8_9ROSA|nr:hypothetical protein FNV43_RR20145 [Rhamnella rubrinervis]